MSKRRLIEHKAAPGRFFFAWALLGGALAACGDNTEPAGSTPDQASAPAATTPVDPARSTSSANPPQTSAVPGEGAHGESAGDSDLPDLSALGPDAQLPLFEIAPGTYVMLAGAASSPDPEVDFSVNAGIVVTGAGVVVIDSPLAPEPAGRLRAAIERVTQEPLTHVIMTAARAATPSLPDSLTAGEEVVLVTAASDLAVAGESAGQPSPYERVTLYLGDLTFDVYRVPMTAQRDALLVHQVDDDILWPGTLLYNGTLISTAAPRRHLQLLQWLDEQFAGTTLVVPGRGGAHSDPGVLFRATIDYLRLLTASGAARGDADAGFGPWRTLSDFEVHHAANVAAAAAESGAAQ